jgi:hypothetical protein
MAVITLTYRVKIRHPRRPWRERPGVAQPCSHSVTPVIRSRIDAERGCSRQSSSQCLTPGELVRREARQRVVLMSTNTCHTLSVQRNA